MSKLDNLIDKAHNILNRVELFLPESNTKIDHTVSAYQWQTRSYRKHLHAITEIQNIALDDLLCIDRQKDIIVKNTQQFLNNLPANNALLWGPRGTGKSSLIKAILNEFSADGLKLIEVDKHDLIDLAEIVDCIKREKYYYIIFCDDLSFENEDASYKSLKVVLDGSISKTPDNVLVYATSNRRHILPEYMHENTTSGFQGEELHMSEAVEEKVSLSERFGIWLSFHPFNQDEYLNIVDHYLKIFNMESTSDNETRTHALRWALERGSRSGRSAWQFVKHWVGMKKLEEL